MEIERRSKRQKFRESAGYMLGSMALSTGVAVGVAGIVEGINHRANAAEVIGMESFAVVIMANAAANPPECIRRNRE